jgi:hypothetical protein
VAAGGKVGDGARFMGKLLGITVGGSLFNGLTAIATMVVGWGLLPICLQGFDMWFSLACDDIWKAVWTNGDKLAGEHSFIATLFSYLNNALKGGFVIKFLILNVLIETSLRTGRFLINRAMKPKAA